MPSQTIIGGAAYRIRTPLVRPYHLSLVTLPAFDSILVRLVTTDGEGFGETTDTPGYYSETLTAAWDWTLKKVPALIGTDAARAAADPEIPKTFAATSVITALEHLVDPGGLPAGQPLPLVGIIQGETIPELVQSATGLIAEGHRTLKFKVGFNVTDDLDRLAAVQKELEPGVEVRVDANQGYSLAQAREFLDGLDPRGIELFEQPLPADAWNDMIELAGSGSPVPLMLDESIEKESDLDMVLDSGCAQAVKFKLMKCASREELERLIHKAQSAGLKVIVGNGVSLDISCLFEAASLFRSRLTENAGEMNGFLKSQVDYLQPGLGAANGRLIFPDHWPGVRWDQVAANALETVHWGEINPDR